MKVVGKPVDIYFDVGKGVFKLEVEVRNGDRALLGAGKKNEKKEADVRVVPVDDNLSNKGQEEEEEEEGLATEIFIPLVHYAHPKVLESSWLAGGKSKKWSEEDVERITKRVESNATLYIADSSLSTSSTIATPLLDHPNSHVKSKKSKFDPDSRITSQSMELTPDLVDIEVKVSDGHWSICGQTLKWWYDVPTLGSSSSTLGLGATTCLEGEEEKDGDGVVKKYTIEIKRRDGPLRLANIGNGGRGVKERECCEGICEDGRCLIM
jgi:hypothetical protein